MACFHWSKITWLKRWAPLSRSIKRNASIQYNQMCWCRCGSKSHDAPSGKVSIRTVCQLCRTDRWDTLRIKVKWACRQLLVVTVGILLIVVCILGARTVSRLVCQSERSNSSLKLCVETVSSKWAWEQFAVKIRDCTLFDAQTYISVLKICVWTCAK